MRPSIFELAGGEPAFLALARAHHARCLADPELNHPVSHPGQHPQHVERLAAYWGEVLGGPPRLSESMGDQAAVLRMHAGNGDLGDLGRRFLAWTLPTPMCCGRWGTPMRSSRRPARPGAAR